jgi:TIR domain
MGSKGYRVFISHASDDLWVAERIAEKIEQTGATTFLDRRDIATGDDWMKRLRDEVKACDDLVALYTPWSKARSWLKHEMGMAFGFEKRIVCVFYRVVLKDFDKDEEGRGLLQGQNIIEINRLADYLKELKARTGTDP